MIIDCDNSTTTTSTPAMICMRNTVHITHLRRGGRCLTAGGISPKFCTSGATPQVFLVFVNAEKIFISRFYTHISCFCTHYKKFLFRVFAHISRFCKCNKKIKNFAQKKSQMNLITWDLKH